MITTSFNKLVLTVLFGLGITMLGHAETVAEWKFTRAAASGTMVRLSRAREKASTLSQLKPAAAVKDEATGLQAGWQPWLQKGWLESPAGGGRDAAGLVTAPSVERAKDAQFRYYLGRSGISAEAGGSVYLVVSPSVDWNGAGRFGLFGTGHEIDGYLRLAVSAGTVSFEAGGVRSGKREMAAAMATVPFQAGKWYFIGASWQGDHGPVLWVREMAAAGPDASLAGITGTGTEVCGTFEQPRFDPLTVGATWVNTGGESYTANGAGGRIAYALVDNQPATVADMERVFASLAAGAAPVEAPAPAARKPGKVSLEVARHAPCNLFQPGEAVAFAVKFHGAPAGDGVASVSVMDEAGKEVGSQEVKFTAAEGKAAEFTVDAGKLGRGYYELVIKARNVSGELTGASATVSVGVMEFVSRSAQEVRDGGYVFGLKWWGGIKNQSEMADAMAKLGLQWTRIIQNEGAGHPERLSAQQLLDDYPLMAAIKVERFPKELYDEQRYGPLEEWEKKYGRGGWTLKTLPKKEPYQKYLREQLAALPADQKCFEIWNEPWDKMSPKDFATLSQWIIEVIEKERPDAIVGPNFYGSSSEFEYDAQVIKAGGLKGMKMVALHPYAVSENRAWMRAYRQWLKEQTGTDMEIYITEYGSHSTPQGPSRRSEMEQSRRVVRQSLSLYVEGAKALIPHWAGQSEANPSYIEDWFGYVRKNEQPKPVLVAHANSARLIDGAKYLGDLWFGPRVEAMLFEKSGTHTLVLWTLDDSTTDGENVARKEITMEPGVNKVMRVDMMGREEALTVQNGKLTLTLDEAPVYLVGVSGDLAKQASKELRADRWPAPEKPPRTERHAGKLKVEPKFDGVFNDWTGAVQLSMVNPKVAGLDCSGVGYVAWDDNYLYVGVDIRDNELLNNKPRAKLYLQDSVELFLSMKPRDTGSGYGPDDMQLFLTPASGEGKPIVGVISDRETGTITDVTGAKFFGGKTNLGWAMEVALPWSSLPTFKPAPGAKLALEMRVNDADTSHERFKIDPADAVNFIVTDPSTWSLLILKD